MHKKKANGFNSFVHLESSNELRDIALPNLGTNANDFVKSLNSDDYTKFSLGNHDVDSGYDAFGWLASYLVKGRPDVQSYAFGQPKSSYVQEIGNWAKRYEGSNIQGLFIKNTGKVNSLGQAATSLLFSKGQKAVSVLEVVNVGSSSPKSFNLAIPNLLTEVTQELLQTDDYDKSLRLAKNIGLSALVLCSISHKNGIIK